MSTESVLLQARLAVTSATENEVVYFGLYALAIILLGAWVGYILRRWSWMPRKRHERRYAERF